MNIRLFILWPGSRNSILSETPPGFGISRHDFSRSISPSRQMHRQYLLPFFPSTALVPVVFLLGHHHFCGRALPLSRFYFGTRPRRNWKGRWNNSERGGWPRVTRRIKIFARGEIIILWIRRDRSMRSAILILLADVEMGRGKKRNLDYG